MGESPHLTDLDLDALAPSARNDTEMTLQRLRAASESLQRLTDALALIGETDAEIRPPPASRSATGPDS